MRQGLIVILFKIKKLLCRGKAKHLSAVQERSIVCSLLTANELAALYKMHINDIRHLRLNADKIKGGYYGTT